MEIKLQSLITWAVVLDSTKGESQYILLCSNSFRCKMNWERKSEAGFPSPDQLLTPPGWEKAHYLDDRSIRTALEEGIEILSYHRATERLVFRVVLIQKGQKWKITMAILHSEWGLYLASCYILYFYITGKCSLYCLQSVKPICANDKEIFSYTLLYLISYFTADTFCPSHRRQAQYPPIIYGPK